MNKPREYWRYKRGNKNVKYDPFLLIKTGNISKKKKKKKEYLETNDNENTMNQNLWNAAKAVLKWKFIAIQFYLKKQ